MAVAHRPVMLAETLRRLAPAPGGLYVDGTVGAGGHAQAILEASSPGGLLLGLDRDPRALALAAERLSPFGTRVRLVQASYADLGRQLEAWGRQTAQGILLDLGVSSMQLDEPQRGFSFSQEGPLDMRMGPEGAGAAELVATAPEKELARIFSRLGEEPFARPIARALVAARRQGPIETTGQLARLVQGALPQRERRRRKLHPATKAFMALRLAVNDELGHLERFLAGVPDWLAPGGSLVIISYHSLEDRMVKRAFKAMAQPCTCPPSLPVCACGRQPLLNLRPARALRPGPREVAENPRARSARLRAAQRTEAAA